MSLEIFDCPQNSPDWYQARLGIPTASMFSTVMASGKGGGPSLTRAKYMRELASERITGEPDPGYSNSHMERGKALEDDARRLYAFTRKEEPRQVGFIRNGEKGGSPDSLIGENGMLEIKTALPHILADILLRDHAPPEHTAQLQGNLWVAEREWIDLTVYWPRLPPFVKRVYRDPAYILEMSKAVERFNEELAEMEFRLRAIAA